MALLLGKLYGAYNVIFTEWSDPRTASWPLIGSPIPLFLILAFYLYFVNDLGPKMMIGREPFKLEKLMLVYNAGQVVVCSYVVYLSLKLAWGGHYRLVCEPVDYTDDQRAIDIAGCVYLYMWIKITDLLDTVFFVFRKKNNQITFLHVYHHTGMVVLVWSCTKYLAGGHGTLLGVINSAVHVVMYSYYFLTILSDKYKQSIWWKKHITQLQIVQFLLLVLHFSILVVTPDCAYPRWVAAVLVPQNLFMLILFADFYRKAYMSKPSERRNSKEATNGTSIRNDVLNTSSNGICSPNDVKTKVN